VDSRGPTVDAPARPVARLSPAQQRTAKLGAAVAAVVFVGLWAPDYPRTAALAASGIGLVMAALLYLAARRGTLVLTALAAFGVSFGPWSTAWMLGAPYIAWSGLLLYRASKAAAEAAGPREPRRKKAVQTETAVAAKRAPVRSKRYTPPAKKRRR
jgi:hypothetical protein